MRRSKQRRQLSTYLVIDFFLLHHQPCDEIITMKNKAWIEFWKSLE